MAADSIGRGQVPASWRTVPRVRQNPHMSELAIKLAGTESADVVAALVQAYYTFDGLTFSPSVEVGVRRLLASPEFGRVWLIVAGEEVAGYTVMTFGYDHEAGGRLGIVTDLYLADQARGLGFGRWVLEHLIEFANSEGLAEIQLFVLRHNQRAKRLYESRGFEFMSDRESMALRLF